MVPVFKSVSGVTFNIHYAVLSLTTLICLYNSVGNNFIGSFVHKDNLNFEVHIAYTVISIQRTFGLLWVGFFSSFLNSGFSILPLSHVYSINALYVYETCSVHSRYMNANGQVLFNKLHPYISS